MLRFSTARTGLLTATALVAFLAALGAVQPSAGPDGVAFGPAVALADDDDDGRWGDDRWDDDRWGNARWGARWDDDDDGRWDDDDDDDGRDDDDD